MDVTAPVTDYIRGSLLTTKGDIIKRGAALNARLGIAYPYDTLQVNAAMDDLAYAHPLEFMNAKKAIANGGAITGLDTWTFCCSSIEKIIIETAIYMVTVNVYGVKGGVAGYTGIRINKKAGTASILLNGSRTILTQFQYSLANQDASFFNTCMCLISPGGTLELQLYVISQGSNLAIGANDSTIALWPLYLY